MRSLLKKHILTLFAIAFIVTAITLIALPISAATPETYIGVSASMDGSVKLNFYYSDLGDADSVVIIEKSPDGAELSRETVTLEGITADEQGRYVISVKMAAAEMTNYVTVYTQKDGEKLGMAHTYSVASYANRVLASDKYSDCHDAVRALLNYGTMAQLHFEVNTDSLANAGLYRNNTNPVSAVTDIDCAAPSYENGTKLTFTGYEAVLESATAFRIYFTYSGDAEISATVRRDGIDTNSTDVIEDSENGKYYIKISNIAPMLYIKQYTVKVTDGSDEMTVSASVMNYVDDVIASDDTTDTQKQTARAMYNHYIWTANAAPAITSCAHSSVHQESADGDTATAYICSICGVEVKTVSDKMDLFHLAPSVLNHHPSNATLMTDSDGTVYTRFAGYTEIYFNNIYGNSNSAQTKATGNYFVIKYRLSATNTNDAGSFVVYAAAGAGDYGSNATIATRNDGEWHTVVFDMTDFMPNNFLASADEKYYGIKVSPRFLTGCADTDTIDIAYWGLCDDVSDLSGIVDETTYDRYTASASYAPTVTATGKCVSCASIVETNDGSTYTLCCSICDSIYAEKDISSVNTFRSAKEISTYGTLFMNPTYKTEYDAASGKYINYASHTYTHTDREGWIYIFSSDSMVSTSNTGRYLVMKLRTQNVTNITFNASTVNNSTYSSYTKNPAYLDFNGKWTTVVVDLAQFANYKTDLDNGSFCFKWQVYRDEANTGTETRQTVDIAYAAIVDDLYEATKLIDDETYNFYGRSTNWATSGATHVTETAACADGCTSALGDYTGYVGQGSIAFTDGKGTVYSYVCSECGVEMARQRIGSGIETFHSALSLRDYAQNNSTVKIDDATAYAQFNGFEDSMWFSSSAETGSYFVLKYRLPSGNEHNSGSFQVHAQAGGGGYGCFFLGAKADDQWHTLVVDLAQVLPGNVLATDGKYIINSMTPRFLTGCSTDDGCTVDVAYIGLCNSLDDIKNILDVDSYDLYTDSTAFTTSHTCANGAQHSYNTASSAGKVICSTCGKVKEVRHVGDMTDLSKSEGYNTLTSSITNGESFVFFTDPHLITAEAEGKWNANFENHLEIMAQHYDNSNATFVLSGGDWLNDTNTRTNALSMMSLIDRKMNKLFGNNYYMLVGNHDLNYQAKDADGNIVGSTYTLTQDEIDNVWFLDERYGGKSYYSFMGENTRFYTFDSGTDWSHTSGNINSFDAEQIEWFLECLDARDDAHIALAPHILYVSGTTLHPATDKILELSSIYNERGIVTYNGKLYDFSEKTGYVEFLIAGHSHKDEISVYYNIPCVLTVNMGSNAAYATFDMIAVDYDARVLNAIRVGSGSDRTIALYGIGE